MGRTYILTSPPVHTDGVKAFQRLMKNHGWYAGPIDGECGPLTAQAFFRSKFCLGFAKPDHAGGDVLYAYLSGKTKASPSMRLRARLRQRNAQKVSSGEKILKEAHRWVGTRESPPNTNGNPFGREYGVNYVAWCCEFLSVCAKHVGVHFWQSYVPNVVALARMNHDGLTIVHSSVVKKGDLVCFDWPGESHGTADHIGVFDHWIEVGKSFETVEGNTSPDDHGNQSNGGEVCIKTRYLSTVQAFVRVK